MDDKPAVDERRRKLLAGIALALGGCLGAAAGVPLVGAAVAPAFSPRTVQRIRLGRLSEFPVGEPRSVTLTLTRADGYLATHQTRLVWVCRLSPERLTVYNARCTHLGCLVGYRPDSQTFLSPCHEGVFALADGRVLSGPPPRPLDTLETLIVGDELFVEYLDFVVGVPDKVPL